MDYRKSRAQRAMMAKPTRKAVQAAIAAQAPVDQTKPVPAAKRKPARKLSDDDLPEF